MRKGLPFIGRGLWKLNVNTIEYYPFIERIRKLLSKDEDKITGALGAGESALQIWTTTKEMIKKVGREEATNQKRQLNKESNNKKGWLRDTINSDEEHEMMHQ
jgi:hypothetical protein